MNNLLMGNHRSPGGCMGTSLVPYGLKVVSSIAALQTVDES